MLYSRTFTGAWIETPTSNNRSTIGKRLIFGS